MPETLEKLLGITDPIVLGPFGGLSSIELTASPPKPANAPVSRVRAAETCIRYRNER